jgi:uroporphyrinogen-III decarboxylase
MIIALVEEGLVPCLFAEGGYNSRLEALKELPKGKTVWHFDQTDIVRAKEELGDRICIMGNVPSSLLVSVSREVVLNHCKELIQVVGKDGGFILSTGAVVDSVIPENLKALIEAAEMYGK